MVTFKTFIDYFMKEVTFFGGLLFYGALSAFFLFTNQFEYMLFFLFGGILLHLIPFSIRYIYFKKRPEPIHYNSLLEKLAASSFPSIHTERAFFIAMFLFQRFNLFGSLAFIGAGLVGMSRIHLKRHDRVDVVVGAVLGIGIALLVGTWT
ncbi:hypothetical protein CL622_06310 [archaeon]|nr:hypothetical protein [archaeon]